MASAGVAVAFAIVASAPPATAYADNDGSNVSIGIDWVAKYVGTGAPAARYGNVDSAKLCCEGLKDIVDDSRTSWQWQFNWGNSAAWELDWKKSSLGGNAYRLCDDVDLVAFAGHGLGNTLEFSTQKNDWKSTPSDMDLGVRDAEWALFYTCNFLRGSKDTLGAAANGIHLLNGYCTDMTVTSDGGRKFAEFAMPAPDRQAYGVRVAWYKYGKATQKGSDKNTVRTFGAKASYNDYLWGYGKVSADPPAYSPSTAHLYEYWDTNLNW